MCGSYALAYQQQLRNLWRLGNLRRSKWCRVVLAVSVDRHYYFAACIKARSSTLLAGRAVQNRGVGLYVKS